MEQIAVPEAAAGDERLRILALLSRKLMDAEFPERLLRASDERAVLDVLREVQSPLEGGPRPCRRGPAQRVDDPLPCRLGHGASAVQGGRCHG
ncbi:PTS sugar transporter subunit IIA [Streptomyces sp. F001]|uniref:PTS sugar transporter subunit IIA n=1 Tax=Streptomyces sp. F001 TaxID=1510026 RepID=UPI00101E7B38